MTFKDQLYIILDELNEAKHNRSELFELSIKDRLKKSLINYNNSIEYSRHVLQQKNPIMILKRINRSLKDDKTN